MSRFRILTVTLAVLITSASFVSVFPATGRFSGKVTSTDANAVAIGEVTVGDGVSGTFSFSSDAADGIAGDAAIGLYSAGSLVLSIGEYEFSSPNHTIAVSNDRVLFPGEPAVDAFEVVSPLGNVAGPSLSGLPPVQIDLVLVDSDATTFADDSLPGSLTLSDFEVTSEVPYGTTGGRLILSSSTTGGIGEVRFEITSLSIDSGDLSSGGVLVYPQLAVGGGYEVVLMVTNRSGEDWSGRAEPLSDDPSLDYLDTLIELGPHQTRKYTLTGGPSAATTALVITPDPGSSVASLSTAYFFNYLSGGKLVDSTGVPRGQSASRFTLPVEKSLSVNTGVAIRRLASQSESPITFRLYDSEGAQVREVERASGFSLFFDEIFDDVPSDFIGSMAAESETGFYLVVLRLEYTGTGFQLTSVPAVAD